MSNRYPPVIQWSLAACLLMIGFAFFYRYVIFMPGLEHQKIEQKEKAEQQVFTDQARSSLITLASVSDELIALWYKQITLGEMLKKYEEMKAKIDSLRNTVISLNTDDTRKKGFTAEFIVILDSMRDYADLNIRSANYQVQSIELKENIRVNRYNANLHKRTPYMSEKGRYEDAEADRDLETYNQKEEAVKQLSEEIGDKATKCVAQIMMFSDKHFPQYGLNTNIIFKLSNEESTRLQAAEKQAA